MDFLASLFGGQNKTLNKDIGDFGGIASFAGNHGTSDISSAEKFWQAIQSGDQSKIAQALAPEISANQQQGQQKKNQLAEFGTRSGGTASAGNSIDAAGRGNIINLIGGLQSSAADRLASTGSGLLSTSLSATGMQADASQARMQNWINSILGGLITGGVGAGAKMLTAGTV